MKNSLNLVLVILFLVVLGCSCPKMDDLTKKSTPTTSSPSTSDTTPSDSKSDSKTTTLSIDKYNKIKDGMSYKEVVDIVGSDGVETFNSTIGKYKTVSYKWEGPNFQFIYATFQNDKLLSKTQANLK